MTVERLINGRSGHSIPAADRGFQYGDGVFTTLPVRSGRPVFLPLHLARLRTDCARLQIPFPGESVLENEVRQLCRMRAEGVVKIQVTRGSGARGYRLPEPTVPTRVLTLQSVVPPPCAFSEQGVTVRWCTHRLGRNPALAGIKHMNRLEQILARSEWDGGGVQEGLMMDPDDALIEGTMSNVFLLVDDTLVTPDVTQCGVAGVMRSVVLAIARDEGIPVEVRTVTCDELDVAREVFLTNSLIRVWPVVALEGKAWPVGLVARHLLTRIDASIRADIGITV